MNVTPESRHDSVEQSGDQDGDSDLDKETSVYATVRQKQALIEVQERHDISSMGKTWMYLIDRVDNLMDELNETREELRLRNEQIDGMEQKIDQKEERITFLMGEVFSESDENE